MLLFCCCFDFPLRLNQVVGFLGSIIGQLTWSCISGPEVSLFISVHSGICLRREDISTECGASLGIAVEPWLERGRSNMNTFFSNPRMSLEGQA